LAEKCEFLVCRYKYCTATRIKTRSSADADKPARRI